MANFDMDNYLKSRFSSITPEKIAELNQVREDKIASVQAARQRIAANTTVRAATQAANDAADANSVVGILGLDPKGIVGETVNKIVGLGSGFSASAGMVGSGLHTLNALRLNADIPQEVKDARARELRGEATPDDLTLLALPRGYLKTTDIPDQTNPYTRLRPDFTSNRQQIADMEAAVKDSESVRKFFDLSSAVHQGQKREITNELADTAKDDIAQVAEGWGKLKDGQIVDGLSQMVPGLTRSAANIVPVALNNPSGTLDYVAENISNMAMAGAGSLGAVGAAGLYGLDTFGKGIADRFEAKDANGKSGTLPNNDDLIGMAVDSALAGAGEYIGNAAMGASKLAKAGAKAIETPDLAALKEAAKAALKNPVANALTDNVLTRTAKAVAEGAAEEYVTEGLQTKLENDVSGKPTSLMDVYQGAAIGGMTGGVIGSGTHTIHELTGTTESAIEKRQTKLEERIQHDKAIQENDTSKYLDTESAQYNPIKAMEVLLGHAALPDTTPEVRDANLAKSKEVITDLEDQLQHANIVNDVVTATPEEKERYASKVETLKTEIADLDPTTDADQIKDKSAELAAIEEGISFPDSVIARKKQLALITRKETELAESQKIQTELSDAIRGRRDKETIDSDLTLAKSVVDPTDTEAVKQAQSAVNRTINLSMSAPQHLSADDAIALADDTKNTLTDAQRLYLREFSAARVAQNVLETTQGVTETISKGDNKGNLGLKQYNSFIGQGIEAGDEKFTTRYLSKLANFAQDHQKKSDVAQAALAQAKDTNRSVQVIRTKDGEWSINTGKALDRTTMRNMGGITAHPNSVGSAELIAAMPLEADALNKALASHSEAYKLSFGKASPVTAVSTTTPITSSIVTPTVTDTVTPTASSGTTVSTATPTTQVAPIVTKPTLSDVYGTGTKSTNISTDLTRVGEVQTSKTGDNTILGMTMQSTVRLKDGTEIPVGVAGGAIQDGKGTVIDARLVTAFKNEVPGAQWVATKPTKLVSKAAETLKSVGSTLLSTASKVRTPVTGKVDEKVSEESSNIATVMTVLGIPIPTSSYKELPSEHEVLSAQQRVLEIHQDIQNSTDPKATLASYKTELSTLIGTVASGIPTADRITRAIHGSQKHGAANPTAHLVLQLGEELNELVTEISRVNGNTSTEGQLKLQKKAFKLLRFGEDTQIKGMPEGVTNATEFESAQQRVTKGSTNAQTTETKQTESQSQAKEADTTVAPSEGVAEAKDANVVEAATETKTKLPGALPATRSTDPKHVLNLRKDAATFEYTNDQVTALEGLSNSMDTIGEENQWHLLNGKAGTGKTTIVENLVNAAKQRGRDVVVMAPTNKAVMVLKSKMKAIEGLVSQFGTLHKLMYGPPVKDKKTGKLDFNATKEDFETIKNTTFLIDEASMVSEKELGKLREAMKGTGNQFILLGDQNQLEPVGENPHIFTAGKSTIDFGKAREREYILNEVRRQALDSTILKFATFLALTKKIKIPKSGTYGDLTINSFAEGRAAALKGIIADPANSVALFSTNKDRNKFNSEVRTARYGDAAHPLQEGEPLIGVVNGNHIVNSETFVAPKIISGPKERTFHHRWNQGTIKGYFYETDQGTILLIPQLAGPSLDADYFEKDDSGEGQYGREWQVATYAYALTTHKSQGSQWNNVYVLPSYMMEEWTPYKLLYTAVTRASKHVTFGVNPSLFGNDRIDMSSVDATINDFIENPNGVATSEDTRTEEEKAIDAANEYMADTYDDASYEDNQAFLDAYDEAYSEVTNQNDTTNTTEATSTESTAEATSTDESSASSNSESNGTAQEDSTSGTTKDTGNSTTANGNEEGKSGGLIAFTKAVKTKFADATEEWNSVNLIGHFLKQTGVKAGNLSNKPLVAVKDFLSSWVQGTPEQFVDRPNDALFTEAQSNAVNNLYGFLHEWSGVIKAGLSVKNKAEGYKHKDLMRYLYQTNEDGSFILENGKPVLEENIVTAIGVGAYKWLLDVSGSPETQEYNQINRMLGRDKTAYISPAGVAFLSRQSAFENTAIGAVGKEIVQALGIVNKNGDTPLDLIPRLEMALGTHAVELLKTQGYIRSVPILEDELQSFFGEKPKEGEEKKVRTFIQAVRTGNVADDVEGIRLANKNSESVINKMFGVEGRAKEPGTEATEYNQPFAKNSKQEVPQAQHEVINKTQHIPHTPIGDMFKLASALGKQAMLTIGGFIDITNKPVHVDNVGSYKAQNDNLENQFDLMMDLVGENMSKAYYVTQNVWKNYRAGFLETAMNLQSSKFHRYMFARPSWTVNIQLANDAKSRAIMDEFLISFAMQMGIKTDKKVNAETLSNEYTKDNQTGLYVYNNPDVMEAVRALHQLIVKGEDISQEEKDHITKVAASEGMGSLQAMVSYAKYMNAVLNKEPEFETTMLVGADGKTNGPMLTLLALGATDFSTLDRGGFYAVGEDQPKHFSDYASRPGSKDLYEGFGGAVLTANEDRYAVDNATETADAQVADHVSKIKQAEEQLEYALSINNDKMAREIRQYLKDMFAGHPFTQASLKAFEVFTGTLSKGNNEVAKAMRDLVKTPITAFFFGSAIKTAVRGMEHNFIQSFANLIENIAQNNDNLPSHEVQEKLDKLFDAANVLMKQSQDAGITVRLFKQGITIEQALKTSLKPDQEAALRRSFKIMMGNATSQTLDTYFSEFNVKRDHTNKVIQAAFETFSAAYQDAKARLIAQLIDEGKMPYREITKGKHKGKKEALRDLTAKEESFLRKQMLQLLPLMHTAYSKAEGNLDAGILAAKSGSQRSQSSLYESEVSVNGVEHNSAANEYQTASPGVAGLSYSIHSSDSFIMHMAIRFAEEALNVHDEISTSPVDIKDTAQAINQQAGEVFLNYSPTAAATGMLQRVVLAMADRAKNGLVTPAAVASMLAQWANVYNRGLPRKQHVTPGLIGQFMIRLAHDNSWSADYQRNANLAQLGVVDQYTWENGQWNVPESFREKAAKQRDEAKKNMDSKAYPAALMEAVKFLTEYAKRDGEAFERMDLTPLDENQEDREDTPIDSEVDTQPEVDSKIWGPLATTPNDKHEDDILALFDKSDVLNAKDVIKTLLAKYAANKTGMNLFYHTLLSQVGKVIPANLTIQMIRPGTKESDVLDPETATKGKTFGWYSVRNGKESIYVMGPEFQHSNVSAELLIHELLHAAVSGVIDDVRVGEGSAAAVALVKNLNDLLKVTQEKAKELGLEKRFKNIFESTSPLDELISYGMTNKEFQDSVLKQVTMPNTVAKTGMQAFVEAITKFFFRAEKLTEEAHTGMGNLFSIVAGLFEEADKVMPNGERQRSYSMAALINTYNTTDIYEALDTGEVSPAFDTHLRSLLTNIVEKLHGPFGVFKEAVMKDTPVAAIDVMSQALATGIAPFTSELQASGFRFNNQTFFAAEQVEASIKAILDTKDGRLSAVREELRKLEAEVRGKLKPESFFEGDWNNATQDEKDQATALYNYLFKKVDNDSLARFAALGLTHEKFNSLLKMPTALTPAVFKDRSVGGTLIRLFDKLLSTANGKLTNTKPGQQADLKLGALVRQLVEIENRRKAILNSPNGLLNFAEQKVRQTRKGTRRTVSRLLNSSMMKKNKNVFVSASAHLVDAVAQNHVKYLFKNMNVMRNTASPGIQGVIAGTLMEMGGASHALQKILREGKAHIEGTRKKIIAYTNQEVLNSFVDGGDYLTDENKKAVTAVLLRTGAHTLLDNFDLKQLEKLVTNSAALQKEIANYEDKLQQYGPAFESFFIEQSKALGYHLITNKVTNESMLKNAHNIANMYTTFHQGALGDVRTAEATKIIDTLTTLYALSYSKSLDRAHLATVFAKENARTDGGNGIRMALLTHKQAEVESKDRIFNGSEALMMKGYIPEVYNPHTDLKTATKAEAEALLNLGYKKVSDLGIDPHDPYREARALYVLRDGGLRPWLSGIFSYTSMRAKGTRHHGINAPGTQAVLTRNRQGAINAMFRPGSGKAFDPRTVKENYMAPLLNASGTAVNYQYLMQTETKDSLLERDNRFDTVLGVLAGNVFDKEKSSIHNRKAVEILYEDFKEGFTKESTAYLEVSADSPHAELREIYKMLPKKTKDDINAIWGKDAMLVRAENLDIAFGYRKLSLSTIFEKEEVDRNAVEKAVVWFTETVIKHSAKTFMKMSDADAERYSKSAAVLVSRGERAWQEVMHEVKDIYVIKNIVTAVNNFKSNLITLALYGVPPSSGVRDMRIAWVGAEEYQRDNRKLFQLQHHLDTGYATGDTSEIKLEIARLKIALSNNPVAELIKAGLMPSIVEDISAEEDPYAYKTALARKGEKYLNKINPTIRKTAKMAYLSHDTKVYKSLSRMTQLSDFVARYALYQHLTTRKESPLSKAKALQEASDAFINYDVPMHRDIQYMDDMGLFMFTKYFLRVQRVIRGRFINAPGKMAMTLAAEQYIGDLPTIMDSSVFVRAGKNPLHAGALQAVGALGDLPVFSLFRF